MGLAMSYLRVPPTMEGEPDPGRVARLVFGTPDWRRRQPAEQVLDLGGHWQALHYLITGDPWDGRQPESDVVCGGRLLTEDGEAELGIDVIFVAPDRVKAAADHLADTSFGTIADRYDPAAMAAAEVQDAAGLDAKTRDRVLKPAYENLTRFFAQAAADGQAVFKVMTHS
ncbi:YfbM family protein [Actinomadura rudentiformis]|uniref:YfbM family protein n=1 Tax=Actinomadura rudentiformis TaxID=359158 RepID=A0A6H9YYI8_9ACTN|nr:YfbM family protein [Actinomadura rudentiformis]KAB2345457.1 YfbM family protein [Actinomadura rudentiformis]